MLMYLSFTKHYQSKRRWFTSTRPSQENQTQAQRKKPKGKGRQACQILETVEEGPEEREVEEREHTLCITFRRRLKKESEEQEVGW